LERDLDFDTLLEDELLDFFKRDRDLVRVLDRDTERDRDLLILRQRERDLLRVRDRRERLLVRDLVYFRGLERVLLELRRKYVYKTKCKTISFFFVKSYLELSFLS